MRRRRTPLRSLPALLIAAGTAIAGHALAAPPPDHPSPSQAMEILAPKKPPAASELPNRGKVLRAINANDYTYIEVGNADGSRWIAAPRMELQPGAEIRYEQGPTMANFYSKVLQR
ncbi:MAG TPA: hypothetical protein VFY24_11675, partial [Azospira sp.]|nr:hypothetical protein [Azospira sp.]